MRYVLLLTVILLSSCENWKDTIANRQEAIQKEMEQVKASYYKKADSLESVKEADTSAAIGAEIAREIVSADQKRAAALLKLQNEYDSLEAELKKY